MSATQGELDSTKTQLSSTRTLLSSTSRDVSSLRVGLSATNGELSQVKADLDEIKETYGNIDMLAAQASSLESEIADLEEQRKPLVLETHRNWFYCTGSMEPKITCLDEATWLDNFHAKDIVVGATISFETTKECIIEGNAIAHRVTKVKEVDGVLYFWPKGDNNRRADGCWIPEDNVRGYIMEIHKDVFADTSTADLRDYYNGARKEYQNFCRRNTVTPGQCNFYSGSGLFERATTLFEKIGCWREIVDAWKYPDEIGEVENSLLLSVGIMDCG